MKKCFKNSSWINIVEIGNKMPKKISMTQTTYFPIPFSVPGRGRYGRSSNNLGAPIIIYFTSMGPKLSSTSSCLQKNEHSLNCACVHQMYIWYIIGHIVSSINSLITLSFSQFIVIKQKYFHIFYKLYQKPTPSVLHLQFEIYVLRIVKSIYLSFLLFL